MHKLARQVRFSVNPFLESDCPGFNGYASNPPGEGLPLFFELGVELTGEVERETGFVVNVAEIDSGVREFAVPLFSERVRSDFREGRGISFSGIVGLLKLSWSRLSDKFGSADLSKLSLAINPFRSIAIDSEDCGMIYFSEKFEFAATHKLWNDDFSEQRNLEVFGKCANPAGHGHNYIVEVALKVPEGEGDFSVVGFERIVNDRLIKLIDHKNLNADVGEFGEINPTVENIVTFAWGKLFGQFGDASLHCVTVWETDKTYCSYYG
ncbi:MAG: 6-carboxytetrahydropterin synthase [Planctomycetes bacterium]|nr:6-carboxytetrahydropterin synthase [Planctomycetota bacterium]